jgi:phenylalanine-4-hydroxylase
MRNTPPAPGLRGDYSRAAADFSVTQDWGAYTAEEHALYRRLFQRQRALVPRYACQAYLDSLARLDAAEAIPRFELISAQLQRATRWELVAVPGLIPDDAFFSHLSQRRFPVTVWLRRPEEADYIAEPDVFHDFFGHVPLLFEPVYADYLQEYGQGGRKALRLDALPHLARLYWYTIEFGLMKGPEGLRAYGAGLLSSGGELPFSIVGPTNGPNSGAQTRRLQFDLMRIMRTDYHIDRFQESYFVIDSFQQLLDATAPDFSGLYPALKAQPVLPADAVLPGDRLA